MLNVLLLWLEIIEKMQLPRSTDMNFQVVLGTSHTLIVNTAKLIRQSYRSDTYGRYY